VVVVNFRVLPVDAMATRAVAVVAPAAFVAVRV
jgi:hypothetical protein